jgi:hypothetical protein
LSCGITWNLASELPNCIISMPATNGLNTWNGWNDWNPFPRKG